MKKTLIVSLVLLITILSAGCQMTGTNPVGQENVARPVSDLFDYNQIEYSPDHVLLRSNIQLEGILSKMGSGIAKEWPEIGWVLAAVPAGETVISFIEEIEKRGDILIAEPNMSYQLDLTARAAEYDRQWAFPNIKAEDAWDITTGEPNVIVAIVDTGVDMNHAEFTDKQFIGAYDVTTGENTVVDLNSHGTHVAGIAADNGRNGQISGVAWDCPIMPVRVMDDGGSIWTTYLIDAMIYLGDAAAANPDKRIVANMSIGGRGYNFAFKDAIDYASERGVLLITSAGNDSKRVISYPGAYNGLVSVAASTPHDEKADFSTIGFWNSVAAPGVKIYSTVPTDLGGYANMQGTSMASPYVTGAAALLLSHNPELTPLEIKNQIEQSARGTGFTEELGYGILDLEALLGPIQPLQYGSLDVTTNIISTVNTGDLGTGVITVFDAISDILVSFGTTGANGNYLFKAIKPGTYDVSITYYDPFMDEYAIKSRRAIVEIGATTTLNFVFTIPVSVIRNEVYSEDIDSDELHEVPITIVGAGTYEFQTSYHTQDCDTVLTLKDSGGAVIATNDDYHDMYSMIRENLQPGDYTVVVEEFSDLHLNTTLTIYELDVTY